MGVNRVDTIDGRTIIDISGDNVQPENVDEGVLFHGADGEQRVGTRTETVIDEAEILLQAEIIDDILFILTGESPDEPEIPEEPELYPDGAFRVVRALTAEKTYVLGFSYEGNVRYMTDAAFNDWTISAADLTVQDQGGYVFLTNNPVRYTAAASGNGFTLATGAGSLTGAAASYGTDLKINSDAGTVFTIDTSTNGGFSSGTYIPKADERAVWIRAYLGDQNCCLKYESGNNSIGIDYAGRDATYSTGFIPFVLYEYCGGEAMA